MNENAIHELLIDPCPFGGHANALESILLEPANQGDRCIGAWTIEYGPLSRVVTLWERVSGSCVTSGAPAESIDWLNPVRMGWRLDPKVAPQPDRFTAPFVDLRIYCIKPGHEDILDAFVENLPAREQYSLCAGMWAAKERGRNLMVHLWPYESFEQRIAVRDKTFTDEQWLNYLFKAYEALEHMQAMQLIPCPLPKIQDDNVDID